MNKRIAELYALAEEVILQKVAHGLESPDALVSLYSALSIRDSSNFPAVIEPKNEEVKP